MQSERYPWKLFSNLIDTSNEIDDNITESTTQKLQIILNGGK